MYKFIDNIGDFFTPGYYTEDFIQKVIALSGYDGEAIKEFNKRFSKLKGDYFAAKGKIKDQRLHKKYVIKETHDLNTRIMDSLGYDTTPAYANWIHVDDESVIPARSILYNGSQARLVILEMQAMIRAHEEDVPAGLFEQQYNDIPEKTVQEQRYVYSQWAGVINKDLPEGCRISPTKINDCVTTIFQLPKEQRPQYIVIFAGNTVFLMEQDKWDHGAYVRFDLEELFSETAVGANRNYYALFYLLASKEVLAGDSQIVLMDKIAEESFKNTYEVTKDLKEGVINAVELLANEAIYYKRQVLHQEFDETDETFAAEVKDDCLNIIYRLLFVFYAEARPEIGILPMDDEAYAKGYSLDILRELEQTPLKSDYSRNSYFFHDSLWKLFTLIATGYNDNGNDHRSFTVKKIDSPLFDDEKLTRLKDVKYRNKVWQEIICSLSLSKEQNRRSRGRISYANLGVNQLGSVYESLLAYRGFYAEEDYIEVHAAGKPEDGTFLVPRSRMGDFHDDEILRDSNGDTVILHKGQYVYRLNGRDRKKSASYYTPEVLTKSTVKYTLKGFVDKLESGEMKAEELLKLKILEPAMGAAAFQNEVINQVAELYLTYRQKELKKHISPHVYQDERQKVKAYIATKNIYGVDLNPTAIELGKLALWLNVMHKDMETPFFAHRLALGNAVIGAWFKAYDKDELCKMEKRRVVSTNWWEKAPHLLHISREKGKIIRKPNEIYHFLIPDKNMLAALKITEEKAMHPELARGMQTRLRDWTKPITENDILVLKKISSKIDKLITEYIADQAKIDKLTANNYQVWGHRSYQNTALFRYMDKELLANSRNKQKSAYHKLVTVMNYWCALWFWEFKDADRLPTREEYWNDIENILDIDFSTKKVPGDRSRPMSQNTYGEQLSLFDPIVEPEESPAPQPGDAEEPIIQEDDPEPVINDDAVYTKDDAQKILESVSSSGDLFQNARTPIVESLANRYHFFHPQLEFIEVFWLRDGFDVIVGNPPWIKLEFDEKDILSEKYPEVSIRSISAPKVREMKESLFASDPRIAEIYKSEFEEMVCQTGFLNSFCNYSLLIGQQTNLYKCILVNTFDCVSSSGYTGLLLPESIYDDPNGQPLRKELYLRLRYHFQYQNELRLFSEVDHHTKYGDQLLGPRSSSPDFVSIHNLFHPATVDACFSHNGHGLCAGKKKDGTWNTEGHSDRIVRFTDSELKTISIAFEGTDEHWASTKLVSIHSKEIISILQVFSNFRSKVGEYQPLVSEGLHETMSVDRGIMKRNTIFPDYLNSELIYSGPHVFAGNPIYKTPRSVCRLNSDYDVVDLSRIDDSFIPRTNYTPIYSKQKLSTIIKGFEMGNDSNGQPVYDNWLDYYKMAFRRMIGSDSERSLSGGIILPNCMHIGGIVSTAFRDYRNLIEFAGLSSSIPLDFYVKTLGISDIHANRVLSFPLGIDEQYKPFLFSRTLRLNCLTSYYAPLWKEAFNKAYSLDSWSINDSRLSPFSQLSENWGHDSPLRNHFERRLALIEIDVISSMALGLTLDDLIKVYYVQFPILQQYENETYYDKMGNIVFTVNRGLGGVGVERRKWEEIRDQQDGKTYIHTIDPAKSELYGGQQVTYYAPYTKCDRIEDYRRAWAHFEKVFNDKS